MRQLLFRIRRPPFRRTPQFDIAWLLPLDVLMEAPDAALLAIERAWPPR